MPTLEERAIGAERWGEFCQGWGRGHRGWLVDVRSAAEPARYLVRGRRLRGVEVRGEDVVIAIDGAEPGAVRITGVRGILEQTEDGADAGLRPAGGGSAPSPHGSESHGAPLPPRRLRLRLDVREGRSFVVRFRVPALPKTVDGLDDVER